MAKNVIKKPQTSLKMRQARAGSIQRKAGGQEAHTHEAKHPPAKTEPALKTQARKQKKNAPTKQNKVRKNSIHGSEWNKSNYMSTAILSKLSTQQSGLHMFRVH
jgi:hypothetical protein